MRGGHTHHAHDSERARLRWLSVYTLRVTYSPRAELLQRSQQHVARDRVPKVLRRYGLGDDETQQERRTGQVSPTLVERRQRV